MKRKRLLWQIYVPVVLAIVTSVFASTWYAADTLRDFSLTQTKDDLSTRAGLISKQIAEPFLKQNFGELKKLCKQIGQESATRITVILPSGKVLADSMEDAEKMDNHADRLEVKQALNGSIAFTVRYSNTLQQKMLYFAIPFVLSPTEAVMYPNAGGVLRLSIPITSLDLALRKVLTKIVFGALVLVLIAAAITLTVSRKITKPLEEMRIYAERLSNQDLKEKITLVPEKDISLEVADLATAMNMMASQLNDRFQLLTKQRNELEAVFSSMVESVIVVDSDEKIINMNKAATKLLGFSSDTITDIEKLQPIANVEMVTFIRHVLSERRHLEEEIVLHEAQDEIHLQAHGTSLLDARGKSFGALIVLHDITHLRRLENMRRDFVANVSHELRTPITTIKGFVETLQDGAISCPEDADRFLGIILKHADRLNAIVDDLLTLSRIEQGIEQKEIVLTSEKVRDILSGVIETCSPKAQEKNITLSIKCSEELEANIDGPLLEQAITNLVVNAIKYSHENSEVSVNAKKTNNEIVITVKDFGVGIEEEHLPRLFERFYRSDKARSRKLGGTGLGLSIVKHIVHAHGGNVTVDSTLGKGSIFSIHIPA